jgi:uncharacterized membrane protein YgcG
MPSSPDLLANHHTDAVLLLLLSLLLVTPYAFPPPALPGAVAYLSSIPLQVLKPLHLLQIFQAMTLFKVCTGGCWGRGGEGVGGGGRGVGGGGGGGRGEGLQTLGRLEG